MQRRLAICLINPRSQPSYWTFDFGMPFYSPGGVKRYSMANGALLSVAALVPSEHEVVIIDENAEQISFESLRRFDVIGVTGMVVQAERMREILMHLRELPALVVAGGPYVTLSEAAFEPLCDVRFIGEAEETWPAFLRTLASDAPVEPRYEQARKTDMTTVPVPRYDLLKRGRYVTAPVQFSRGCPFLCEFCDIITIFGRTPRTKRPEQVLAELDALCAAGFSSCFLVDDNFIGNKAEAKKLLRRIIEWQESRGYPLIFSTEASINLAEDRELISLMAEARFVTVFIGIETPRTKSLIETHKKQNIHGDSLLAKVDRIRRAGIKVIAGFIVGFDNDDEYIFDEQFEFIQASGISDLSISLLTPLPKTPLYDRLRNEGRLDYGDPELIYVPKQMTREQLKVGFRKLLNRVFDVEAYFDRVFDGRNATLIERQAVAPRKRPPVREDAHAADVSTDAATRAVRPSHVRRRWVNFVPPRLRALARPVLNNRAAASRALKLAFEMARNGEFWRHVRACRQIIQRNAAQGSDALGFGEFIDQWVTYWHFASVTRHLRGTRFGTVPETQLTEEQPRLAAVPPNPMLEL